MVAVMCGVDPGKAEFRAVEIEGTRFAIVCAQYDCVFLLTVRQ